MKWASFKVFFFMNFIGQIKRVQPVELHQQNANGVSGIENERLEPKVMEVDGSDDIPFQVGDFQVPSG